MGCWYQSRKSSAWKDFRFSSDKRMIAKKNQHSGNWCDIFRRLIQQLREGVYQLRRGSSQSDLRTEKAKALLFERWLFPSNTEFWLSSHWLCLVITSSVDEEEDRTGKSLATNCLQVPWPTPKRDSEKILPSANKHLTADRGVLPICPFHLVFPPYLRGWVLCRVGPHRQSIWLRVQTIIITWGSAIVKDCGIFSFVQKYVSKLNAELLMKQ